MTPQEIQVLELWLKYGVALLVAVVAIFSSTGFWNWFSTRKRNDKLQQAMELMDAQSKAANSLLEAHKTLLAAQEGTVKFLRTRLDEVDKKMAEEDKLHIQELQEVEDRYRAEIKKIDAENRLVVGELQRQLNVFRQQYTECQKLLHEKSGLVDHLQAQLNEFARELRSLRSQMPAKPNEVTGG